MSQFGNCREGDDPSFLLNSAFCRDAGFEPKVLYRNLSPPKLYAKALAFEPDTQITSSGALATTTGNKTGRSPRDKRIVREPGFEDAVWWGEHSPNYEIDEGTFLMNREAAVGYLNTVDRVYVVDGFANWDPQCRMKIRVVCSREHHALFAHNMLIRPTQQELVNFGDPDFVIWNAGAFAANRYQRYMSSRTSIATSLKHRQVVILGTEYAGEMKKGVFTLLHYYMPHRDVLFLHSGCNIGKAGDVTLFLGLSGTGKTTSSSDPSRPLIGDDEHCWGPNGVFNIEAGCYAKCVNVEPESDPDMWSAVNSFGTVLENVVYDQQQHIVDYSNTSITENMRACFPITHLPNAHIPCVGGHPHNVILLSCDALGVLPAVSRLTVEQAMYHFVSGYTAKVAGTEVGVWHPEPTFSACYAGAFIMWHPMKYAALLGDKMRQHGTHAWLVNTGWLGGKPGIGQRIGLRYTRAIIDAIHGGALDFAQYQQMPVFNLQVPVSCPGVPDDILHPVAHWTHSQEYTAALARLAVMFLESMQVFLEDGAQIVGNDVMQQILGGGPQQQQEQQQMDWRWQLQSQPEPAATDSTYSVHDQEAGAQDSVVEPVQRQLKQLNLQRSKVNETQHADSQDVGPGCCTSLPDGSDDDLHVHLTVVESRAAAGKLEAAGSGSAAAPAAAGPRPRGSSRTSVH